MALCSSVTRNWQTLLEFARTLPPDDGAAAATTTTATIAAPPPRRLRQHHTRLTPAQKEDIITLYQQGVPVREICQRYGISKQQVSDLRNTRGIARRPRGLNDEQKRQAKQRYIAGQSCAAIGRRALSGLLGKAPPGYRNVRRRDENGREVRTVALDKEHAPLIRLAFQEYVTGNWTVRTLADHLNNRDLTVPPTAHKPATPSQSSGCRSCCATPTTRALSPSRASSTRDSTSHWWTLPPGRRCKTSWQPTPTASGSACTIIISRAPSSAASAVPDGAFYVYFDVSATGLSSGTSVCEHWRRRGWP